MFNNVLSLWWSGNGVQATEPVVAGLEGSCTLAGSTRGISWPVFVRDLSLDAIQLLLHRRFEPGTLLVVNLPACHGRRLIAKVTRTTPQAGGWLAIGKLVDELGADDLQALAEDRPIAG